MIGSVYSSRTPMWVPDVSLVPNLHVRRPRYRMQLLRGYCGGLQAPRCSASSV